jgi:hypothetical protein
MTTEEKKSNVQKYIDILVVLDFAVSMVGGCVKNCNEVVANYCFSIGAGLLFLAVIGICYKYIKK